MRVVAGELKGRKLRAPRGDAVRPTADKVREALFSILGSVEGASVLDLYAGTGALAIEALSRGAAAATLVDLDTLPAQRNLEDLDLKEHATLVRADALQFLDRPGEYDLILCDPPYTLAAGLDQQLDKLLLPRIAPEGRVVVESATREPLRLSLPLLSEHRYGDTQIVVHGAPAS